MTNKDKYKTPKERDEGFSKFCKSQEDCLNCKICKEVSITRESRNCKFAWLALEAEAEDEENKSDKPVLTNEEKYKSVEEQTKAYVNFCASFNGCYECPALRNNVSCDFVWLTLKSYEEKHD